MEELEEFKRELQKKADWDFPVSREGLACACGIVWNTMEHKAEGKRNVQVHSTYGKALVKDWNRMSDLLIDLFQKANRFMYIDDPEDAKLRSLLSYILANKDRYTGEPWTAADDINFVTGFLMEM